MEFAVGDVVEGKVTGITKYGAFVSLPGGKSGMVHISEISYTYVNEVSDYLTVGQDVKVKIIAMDQNGRINLSIKQTQPAPARGDRGRTNHGAQSGQGGTRQNASRNSAQRNSSYRTGGRTSGRSSESSKDQSFDDMLKRFMDDSNSKLSSVREYADHRTRGRRR